MDQLTQALAEIQERNKRVEQQKAWETSRTRRIFIASMTYATAFLYMTYGLGVERAYLDAFVPTGGYLISTFSLPLIKDYWFSKIYPQ